MINKKLVFGLALIGLGLAGYKFIPSSKVPQETNDQLHALYEQEYDRFLDRVKAQALIEIKSRRYENLNGLVGILDQQRVLPLQHKMALISKRAVQQKDWNTLVQLWSQLSSTQKEEITPLVIRELTKALDKGSNPELTLEMEEGNQKPNLTAYLLENVPYQNFDRQLALIESLNLSKESLAQLSKQLSEKALSSSFERPDKIKSLFFLALEFDRETGIKHFHDLAQKKQAQLKRLAVITKWADEFKIPLNSLPIDKEMQVNLVINDIEDGKIKKGKTRLLLLNQLFPNDAAFNEGWGWVSFHENEMEAALAYFKALADPKPSTKILHGIAEFNAGSKRSGMALLRGLHRERYFHPSLHLAMAEEFMSLNNYEEALEWLSVNPGKDQKTWRLFAKAFFLQGRHDMASKSISHLDEESLSHPSMAAINIHTHIALNDINSAIDAARYIKNDNKDLIESEKLNPYLAAATLYKDKLNDPQHALNHLSEIDEPTHTSKLMETEIHTQRGDFEKAYTSLLDTIKKGSNSETDKIAARIFFEKKMYYDAFNGFQKIANPTVEEKEQYLQAAIAIGRYDIASELLPEPATPHEEISWLQIQRHLGKIKSSNALLEKLYSERETLSKQDRLRLVPFYYNDPKAIQELLKPFTNVAALSEEDRIAYLDTLISLGQIKLAGGIIEDDRVELEKNKEGQRLLARYYESINQNQKALEWSQKASENDISLLMNTLEIPQTLSENDIEKFKKEADDNPAILENALILGQAYLTKALSQLSQKEDPKPAAEKAFVIFELLSIKNPNFPTIWSKRGEAEILLGRDMEATDSFSRSLSLDKSNATAARLLALAYAHQKNFRGAFKTLDESLLLNPMNSSLWYVSGELQARRGNLFEAKAALQSALKYNPGDTKAWFELAKVLASLQNPEGALKALKEVVKFDPDNSRAKELALTLLDDPLIKINTSPKKMQEERNFFESGLENHN